MLVSQTTDGVARVVGTGYEVLDVGGASLSDLVTSGAMHRLAAARVLRTLDRGTVTVQAPIGTPGKIVIVGLNYVDHAKETGMSLPRVPRVHVVSGSAVTGPCSDIRLPRTAEVAVDYEGEMAVVIGAPAREVSIEAAWQHVAGITAANDLSARDVQNGTNALVAGANVGLAKGFDGFKPLGPALLTADSVRDGQALILRTRVDGEVRQQSSTARMHFSAAHLISWISRYMTLHRGDVILTGTPGGTGAASNRFLRAGQMVEVELEGVGTLCNRIAAPEPSPRSIP
ncbi:fumarylacetoacetate hydrolase family protein [Streptomyces sp. NPDC049936]|uniref:fumarylacetoacetate hydrolase family protein n=1 Tax=Streptomyces sp. NPDC049936 TaxID=3365599 RepID=UPI0037AFCB39